MNKPLDTKQVNAAKLLWRDDHPDVAAYLDRCQVDTPESWVSKVWALVAERREAIGNVIEFGAGDGRFASHGCYGQYVGYEVDKTRASQRHLPANAQLVNACAFSVDSSDADLCIGNPPYVRNQDLPAGWRETVSLVISSRIGVHVSGLANAWQYFFFQALASTRSDGLIALVVPYEWVSRPSARSLREYIKKMRWSVDVYRLPDSVFGRLLTTSSITIVDKANTGKWRYFDTDEKSGRFVPARTATLGHRKVINYSETPSKKAIARRGLSPGNQKVFVLTEGERVRHGLRRYSDVIPAVTTLRHMSPDTWKLTCDVFENEYVLAGARCWLIRTDKKLSRDLGLYLDSIAAAKRNTSTCNQRALWWNFSMPETPEILISMGFRGQAPKSLLNDIGARAVGGVSGIYCQSNATAKTLIKSLRSAKLKNRLVSYSTGLLKIEINQLNTLIHEALEVRS